VHDRFITRDEALAVPRVLANAKLTYGDHPAQRVDRFDAAPTAHAGVMLLHGGCWRDAVDAGTISPLAAALAADGITTWNAEFRRLDGGGGYPETFDDVSAAADLAWADAQARGIDPTRLVIVGHSAGGHLALWCAARRCAAGAAPAGVVALAAVCDLAASMTEGICSGLAARFTEGAPERLMEICPTHLLPLGVPHEHLVGADDQIVPVPHVEDFVDRARAAGDDARITILPGAHFEPLTPRGPFWDALLGAIERLARTAARG
jgi:acetyl esterase/lipase